MVRPPLFLCHTESTPHMAKYLNIDAIQPEPEVTILVDGVEHQMKVQTLNDLIVNLKTLAEYDAQPNKTPADEVITMAEVIHRAFPTLTKERIGQLPLEAINKLFMVARGAEPDDAEVEAAENPPVES